MQRELSRLTYPITTRLPFVSDVCALVTRDIVVRIIGSNGIRQYYFLIFIHVFIFYVYLENNLSHRK